MRQLKDVSLPVQCQLQQKLTADTFSSILSQPEKQLADDSHSLDQSCTWTAFIVSGILHIKKRVKYPSECSHHLQAGRLLACRAVYCGTN
jgi:hypothetical protein